MTRKALGRGLSSLIPQAPVRKRPGPPPETNTSVPTPTPPNETPGTGVLQIDLDRIRRNREQPRKSFDEASLQELARSLEEQGVIQPIVVRPVEAGQFELIVGERRWRAAQLAGLLKIPAIVRDTSDDRVLELALIENIQREELNPVEVATALHNLIEHLGLTQEQVAERIGKPRSTVANLLRLLSLPGSVQDRIREGRISFGQAKALAAIASPGHQREVAERIVKQSLSVREVEQLVKRLNRDTGIATGKVRSRRDPNIEAAETTLERAIGTKVRIHQKPKGAGRIELHVFSSEEMDRVYQLLVQVGGRSQ